MIWRFKKFAPRQRFLLGLIVLLALCPGQAQSQDSRFQTPTIEPSETVGGQRFGGDTNATEELEDIEGEAIPSGATLSQPDFGQYGPVGGDPTRFASPADQSPKLEYGQGEVISESRPLPNQYRGESSFPDWMGDPADSEYSSNRRSASPLSAEPQRTAAPRKDSPRLRIDGMKAIEQANRRFDQNTHEIVRERYSDGSVKIVRTITQDAEGNYYNDGGWLMYDRQQRPIASGTFVRGAMEGDWERVHESGDLFSQAPFSLANGPYISRANFVHNNIDGVWTISDRDGKLICSIAYQDGVRAGVASWYFPSGKKMREATFKDGVPHGFVLQWDQQGKLQRREQFVDGRRIIRKKSTYPNNQIATERVFRDRKVTPDTSDNWWAAKPATFERSGEAVQYGPVAEWYPNRQPKMTGRYVEGDRDGLFTWWHETHNKKAEGNFSRGKRNGIWRYWHESGMKRSEGRFEDDKPTGIWRSWNRDGKVVDEKDFSNLEPEYEEVEPSSDGVTSVFDGDSEENANDSAGDSSPLGVLKLEDDEPVFDDDPFREEQPEQEDPGAIGILDLDI